MGQLASGIAHGFNNVLTAILGYSQFGITALGPTHPVTDHLKTIRLATERAINLTDQLLVFSRRKPIEEKVFDLNSLLIDQGKLVNSVLGAGIELVVLPEPNPIIIKVDCNQMAQVLLNLAINAKDAMPRGGKLTITTSTVTVDAQQLESNPEAIKGQFVLLSVSDNGVGMNEGTRSHIFEPFFTTKEIGKGTGLGLATCYGFVKQCGGFVEVESELGAGTEFKLFLPITDEIGLDPEPLSDNATSSGGNETILLVEDEPLILAYASQALRREGYRVLEATNGEEAIELAKGLSGDEIHLLLSDVVMPRMGGLELADRFQYIKPRLPVLFTSGYADQSEFGSVRNPAVVGFLAKPYSPKSLSLKVREILDK